MKNVGDSIRLTMQRNPHLKERLKAEEQAVLADKDVQAFLAEKSDEINDKMIKRSMSKLYEFVQEKERIARGETPKFANFHPELIMNVGYIDVTYVASAEYLARQKALEKSRRVTLLDLPKTLKTASFDNFDVSEPARQEALEKALTFENDFLASPNTFHQALYVHGAYGVGKTYLLAALANDLADSGYKTTLVHYPKFANDVKAAIQDNSVQQMVDELQYAAILMFDDIGAETNSAWVRDDILGVILQYRMQEELPTFFSSNFSMKNLEQHLARSSQGAIEEVKASRIMERIIFLSEEVQMGGRNRRHD